MIPGAGTPPLSGVQSPPRPCPEEEDPSPEPDDAGDARLTTTGPSPSPSAAWNAGCNVEEAIYTLRVSAPERLRT